MARLYVVTGHLDGDDPTCSQHVAANRDEAEQEFQNNMILEADVADGDDAPDVYIDCVSDVGEYDPATNSVKLEWVP